MMLTHASALRMCTAAMRASPELCHSELAAPPAAPTHRPAAPAGGPRRPAACGHRCFAATALAVCCCGGRRTVQQLLLVLHAARLQEGPQIRHQTVALPLMTVISNCGLPAPQRPRRCTQIKHPATGQPWRSGHHRPHAPSVVHDDAGMDTFTRSAACSLLQQHTLAATCMRRVVGPALQQTSALRRAAAAATAPPRA